ncbi:MAG: hypothetical protein EBY23_04445 [Actinobacteria bacterium]|uniref:Unannotated protein n=1 Tax=freshwater metagenome TaxID=449393 RepID=A0A6J7UHQ4_9ZZZZ|nr:hypothetical protein [Actinomycetota bacterium]MTH93470.1 hypothetical protein [Actinomycetota bacterium]NDG66164.1 hypothetical protein [Actinomycetota bacterium]
MHDIADLELRGVPSLFVASSEFINAASAQAEALGFPDIARVFVGHPIQDRTDDEMRELAELSFPEILRKITSASLSA